MDRNFRYTEVINMNIYEKLGRINILQRDSEDIFSDIGSIIDNKISDIISDSTVDFSDDDISIINSKLSFLINNLEEYKKIISGKDDKDIYSCKSYNIMSLFFDTMDIETLISKHYVAESTKLSISAVDEPNSKFDLAYILYNDNNLERLIVLVQSKERYTYHISNTSGPKYDGNNEYTNLYKYFKTTQFISEIEKVKDKFCTVICDKNN